MLNRYARGSRRSRRAADRMPARSTLTRAVPGRSSPAGSASGSSSKSTVTAMPRRFLSSETRRVERVQRMSAAAVRSRWQRSLRSHRRRAHRSSCRRSASHIRGSTERRCRQHWASNRQSAQALRQTQWHGSATQPVDFGLKRGKLGFQLIDLAAARFLRFRFAARTPARHPRTSPCCAWPGRRTCCRRTHP